MNIVDYSSYADDNTPYIIGNFVKEVINSLKEALYKLFYWFANNQLKANPDKRHFRILEYYNIRICITFCICYCYVVFPCVKNYGFS